MDVYTIGWKYDHYQKQRHSHPVMGPVSYEKKKSLSLETANYAKPDNNLHLNTEFQ